MKRKNLLSLFLVPLFFLGFNCNKEMFEGKYDLNNDGNPKMVLSRNCPNGHILYFPSASFDTDTIYNFGSIKPLDWGFGYENDDEFLDIWGYRHGENGDRKFVVYNNNGVLLGEKENKVE